MNFKEWFLKEIFDSVSEFLINPKHHNKTWDQLMKEFEASGGKYIGSGKHGQVFDHPSWPYVLKIFSQDSLYTSFVRFAYRNPHPSFPKFYGPPQRILPSYRRSPSLTKMYLVRMEKLNPVNKEIGNFLTKHIEDGAYYVKAKEMGQDMIFKKRNTARQIKAGEPEFTDVYHYPHIIDMLKKYPKLYQVFEGWNILMNSKLQGSPDIHSGNFMQRENGDIVIIDPFWEGSNPYADYQKMIDMEIDAVKEPLPQNVLGGKYPIKKRKKKVKPKPKPYIDNDEIPF